MATVNRPDGAGTGSMFTKMSGAGNDFIVIDNRSGMIRDASDLTRRISTRRLSVGADGVILIETSSRASFRMRYLNSDGSETDFCGNGTRCAARLAFLSGIAPRRMTIETPTAIIPAEVEESCVTISLPPPQGLRPDVPLAIGNTTVHGSWVRVGVPHYVILIRGELWEQDIEPLGRAIRNHPDLRPEGANVNFVVIEGPHSIDVRTYERGVENETLACGSGVVASATTCAMFGRAESPVSVRTRSGVILQVSFDRTADGLENVKLTGDARVVFHGELTRETLDGFDPEWVRDPTAKATAP
jgi:diaminopimelate epimerase